MRQQDKVISRICTLMRSDRLVESRHCQGKGPLLNKPACKEMGPDKGQTRADCNDPTARSHRDVGYGPTGSALRSTQIPLGSLAIDVTLRDPRSNLVLGGFGQQVWAGALWVLLEQHPQQSLLDFCEFKAGTKRWT